MDNPKTGALNFSDRNSCEWANRYTSGYDFSSCMRILAYCEETNKYIYPVVRPRY